MARLRPLLSVPEHERHDGRNDQAGNEPPSGTVDQPGAKPSQDTGGGENQRDAAEHLRTEQRQDLVAGLHGPRYPAQQESLATSRVNVWAASFRPSTVVR